MRNVKLGAAIAMVLVGWTTPAPHAQERQVITIDSSQGVLPGLPGGRRDFKTGTGRIRGRIVSADTGQPVRRVQVRLTGQDVAPKTMLTDVDGR
jgi:hypothetical protein